MPSRLLLSAYDRPGSAMGGSSLCIIELLRVVKN